MTESDIRRHCLAQRALLGRDDVLVALRIGGKPWGKRTHARLFKRGGPLGRIVADGFERPGVIALFRADEVLRALDRAEASGS